MTSPLQQKKLRVRGPCLITANRTRDGIVVYRTRAGSWSPDLFEAEVIDDPALARSILSACRTDLLAVGAYIAPLRIGSDGRVAPGNLRERIRAHGPTFIAGTRHVSL